MNIIETTQFIYEDIRSFIQEDFMTVMYPLLTDPNNYGTMDQEEMYLLIGAGSAIALALLMMPLAVRQQEKKWVKRRSWVRY